MKYLVRLTTLIILVVIRMYQLFVSPITPSACRYHPTCSQYAFQAVLTHGPLRGLLYVLKRILRCQPWGSSGLDPVPAVPSEGLLTANKRNKSVADLSSRNSKYMPVVLNNESENLF
ncbi:MAG: membrane protein insertion efficiency factor YidD [Pseudomonadota bacterium]|nr:membrane protein insertion efficiency factor YidD [Pseudomonadota bacterium]